MDLRQIQRLKTADATLVCGLSVGEHERPGQHSWRDVLRAEEHHRQGQRPDESGGVSGYLPRLCSR